MNLLRIVGAGAALAVAGGLVGYVVGYRRGAESAQGASASAAAAASPAMPPVAPSAMPSAAAMPSTAIPSLEATSRIDMNRKRVAESPKDWQAWVQLGNDYFDTHQRDLAIEAYGHALELEPNDPNVITDQGVMYREGGNYDQAIANFERANKVAPDHMESLFNLGVVWAYDKKEVAKGAAAWRKILEAAPSSEQAAKVRQALRELGQPVP